MRTGMRTRWNRQLWTGGLAQHRGSPPVEQAADGVPANRSMIDGAHAGLMRHGVQKDRRGYTGL